MSLAEDLATNGAGVQPITATPAREWKRQRTEGDLYELPGSGNVARLARLSLSALAATGGPPNDIADRILSLMAVELKTETMTPEKQLDTYKRNQKAFVEVAARVLLSPRLIIDREPNYEADEIGPQDLADRDYTWLFYTWINGTADQRRLFRAHQQSGTVYPR